jgi:hypothetical protein
MASNNPEAVDVDSAAAAANCGNTQLADTPGPEAGMNTSSNVEENEAKASPEKKRKRATLMTQTKARATISPPKNYKGSPAKVDGRNKNKGARERESYTIAYKANMVLNFDAYEVAQKDLGNAPTVRDFCALNNLDQKFEKFLR